MAVELTKVALWIETVDPGLPLGFFDSQIRCGDSLLGIFKFDDLLNGIPDSAYKVLTGDDKSVAKHCRQENRDVKKGQGRFDFATEKYMMPSMKPLVEDFVDFRKWPENKMEDINKKAEYFKKLREGERFVCFEKAANLYIGAFLLPKKRSLGVPAKKIATTEDVWMMLNEGKTRVLTEGSLKIARQSQAFHWPLEFPHVMQRGGFDVVLGNPPWERVELQKQEFFATRDPEIANARNAAAREKLIKKMRKNNPNLAQEWQNALRATAAKRHFIRSSGHFPLGGGGDVNTYAAFADLAWQLVHPSGRAGVIVPNGLVAGFTYRKFLQKLLSKKSLVSFYGFENGAPIFKDVHPQTKFGLLTITGTSVKTNQPWFTAHLRQPAEITDSEKRYTLTVDEIRIINPNTLNLPTFHWTRDAKVTAAIHTAAPILITKEGADILYNDWKIDFQRMFDMASDSVHFIDHDSVEFLIKKREGAKAILKNNKEVYPLYEGKMFWHFDHRCGTYEGQTEQQANQGVLPKVSDEQHSDSDYRIQPRYWVDGELTLETLGDYKEHEWSFAFRDVGPSERTFIGTAIPRTAAGHTAFLLHPGRKNPKENVALVAVLSSLVCDYAARQKSTRMSYFVVEQLPVLSPKTLGLVYDFLGTTAIDWLAARVFELCYTNDEMVGLAKDMECMHGPFPWSPERRQILQSEIDAAMFHLYNLDRAQTEWILDSFTVLRRYEERDYKEFRTKKLVLAVYDAMTQAKNLGSAYVSSLNPPSAAPVLCHPNK